MPAPQTIDEVLARLDGVCAANLFVRLSERGDVARVISALS